jgi:G3E family GTPase
VIHTDKTPEQHHEPQQHEGVALRNPPVRAQLHDHDHLHAEGEVCTATASSQPVRESVHQPVREAAAAPVPVWLITGFLGSGKTTLVNRLLRDAALSQAAVVVGEYGEVGVDHVLIEAPSKRVRLVDSGCICGTVHDEIAGRLLDLDASRDDGPEHRFDCVLIETSGLADPVPVVQLLLTDEAIAGRFALRSVITVVDGLMGEDSLENHPESLKQLAVADTVVISKTDLADAGTVDALRARVAALNPGARLFTAAHGAVDADALLAASAWSAGEGPRSAQAWLAELQQAAAVPVQPDPSIRTLSLVHEGEVTRPGLVLWLNLLAGFRGAGLLRVKGLVNVEGRPVAIHAVQRVISEPVELEDWPDDDRRTRLVVIARGMQEADITATFDAFRIEAGRDRRNTVLRPERYREFQRVIQAFR